MQPKKVTIPSPVAEITFAKHVGSRIRVRRIALRLSQEAIAASCDISRPFLSDVENGKRGIGFFKLYEIAKVLRCPTDWFAEGWETK